jgi:hypothetical protein
LTIVNVRLDMKLPSLGLFKMAPDYTGSDEHGDRVQERGHFAWS